VRPLFWKISRALKFKWSFWKFKLDCKSKILDLLDISWNKARFYHLIWSMSSYERVPRRFRRRTETSATATALFSWPIYRAQPPRTLAAARTRRYATCIWPSWSKLLDTSSSLTAWLTRTLITKSVANVGPLGSISLCRTLWVHPRARQRA